MTTFTKVSDSEQPLIEVDGEKKLSKIDPMTYGGFTEYVWCPDLVALRTALRVASLLPAVLPKMETSSTERS
jgi:hypothetical protein